MAGERGIGQWEGRNDSGALGLHGSHSESTSCFSPGEKKRAGKNPRVPVLKGFDWNDFISQEEGGNIGNGNGNGGHFQPGKLAGSGKGDHS